MSLQIWLPLNKEGDFTNRGVGDMNIVSNTSQYNSTGKIGGCAEMNSQLLKFNSSTFNSSNLTEMSVCAWVYLNSDYKKNYGFHLISIGGDSCRICFSKDGYAVRGIFGYVPTRIFASSSRIDSDITSGKWYHVACTVKCGEKVRIYINGKLDSETNFTKTEIDGTANQACIIGSYNTEYCHGRINDFRLYDHSLSPKEVKEISQGLVVHHKLNDICSKNLFEFDIKKYTKDDPYVWTSARADANATGCKIKALNLVPGKTYTFSCCTDREIRDSHNTSVASDKVTLWFYLYSTNAEVDYFYNSSTDKAINFRTNTNVYKEEGYNRYSWRYTIPEGYQACCVRVNHYADGTNAITSKYWDFKLEEGDVFTSDMRDGTSYDSSGYNVDGTITGDFTMQSDSPRYDKCVKCNGVNNIKLKNPLYNYYDSFTFAFWYKHSSENKTYHIITCNGDTTFSRLTPHTGWWISQRDGYGMWVYIINKYLRTNITIDNNWHHWVVTYIKDDTLNNYKLYLDGVSQSYTVGLNTTEAASYIPTFKEYLLIGGEQTYGGFYYEQYGNLSDFRIYATALSAEDVRGLYETSASIDNKGNLHAYELRESTENLFTLEKLLETVNTKTWDPNGALWKNPQWVTRNGVAAMAIGPEVFDYRDGDSDNPGVSLSSHLGRYFKAGKQYKIDLWIDSDDIYSDSSGQQRGGIRLWYTDNTNTAVDLCTMGDINNPKGFQHVTYYTDPTKTIRGIHFYYFYHIPAYYRADSSITEVKDETITKSGIVETGGCHEAIEDEVLRRYDNKIECNSLIEV